MAGVDEVEAMARAPIATPEVLWRKPPVLALAALPGRALGRLGEPSTASSAAWAAAGASARLGRLRAVRRLRSLVHRPELLQGEGA